MISTDPIDKQIYSAAENVLSVAKKLNIHISTAESCTGGMISCALTEIPGASDVFKGGIVSYTNEVKNKTLKVKIETLKTFTAISEQTAIEMAKGASLAIECDAAISVTGLAGPSGGTSETPVGTICFGYFAKGYNNNTSLQETERCLFKGDRNQIRKQATLHALQEFLKKIEVFYSIA